MKFFHGFIWTGSNDPLEFTSVYEVVKIASSLLIVSGFFQISDGLQAVVLGALTRIAGCKYSRLDYFFLLWHFWNSNFLLSCNSYRIRSYRNMDWTTLRTYFFCTFAIYSI